MAAGFLPWPLICAQVSGEREMLALYQAADVVLDTYPAGSYLTSLQVTPRGNTLSLTRVHQLCVKIGRR